MADEAAEKTEGAEAAPQKKKSNPMMLIGMIAGVLVVLLGGSFFALTKLMPAQDASAQGESKDDGHGGGDHGKGGHGKGGHGGGIKLEVKDLVMNPADTGAPRFVKISLVFELEDQKTADELADKDYRVRDLLISLVGKHTASELSGPEVRDHLRAQIMEELNASVADGKIADVFFTDYIVQ